MLLFSVTFAAHVIRIKVGGGRRTPPAERQPLILRLSLFFFVFQAGQPVVLGNQSNDAGSVEIITVEMKCPLAAVPVGWGAQGKLKR